MIAVRSIKMPTHFFFFFLFEFIFRSGWKWSEIRCQRRWIGSLHHHELPSTSQQRQQRLRLQGQFFLLTYLLISGNCHLNYYDKINRKLANGTMNWNWIRPMSSGPASNWPFHPACVHSPAASAKSKLLSR